MASSAGTAVTSSIEEHVLKLGGVRTDEGAFDDPPIMVSLDRDGDGLGGGGSGRGGRSEFGDDVNGEEDDHEEEDEERTKTYNSFPSGAGKGVDGQGRSETRQDGTLSHPLADPETLDSEDTTITYPPSSQTGVSQTAPRTRHPSNSENERSFHITGQPAPLGLQSVSTSPIQIGSIPGRHGSLTRDQKKSIAMDLGAPISETNAEPNPASSSTPLKDLSTPQSSKALPPLPNFQPQIPQSSDPRRSLQLSRPGRTSTSTAPHEHELSAENGEGGGTTERGGEAETDFMQVWGTSPVGVIGTHKPREILRIDRDYTGGETCQFSSVWPEELAGRVSLSRSLALESFNLIHWILVIR